MKKFIPLFLVLVMAIALFAGCDGGTTTGQTTTGQTTTKSGETTTEGTTTDAPREKVTIEAFMVGDDWVDEWPAFKAKFESEYDWIEVIEVGTGPEAGFLQSRIAANDIPDIVSVDNTEVSYQALDAGLIQDLSDKEVTKNIPQAYLDAFTRDGKIFGLTQGAAFTCLYVNMAALKEAGWDAPPADFEELLAVCQDLKDKTAYAPLTVAGDKTTTAWMVYEGIIANEVSPDWGAGVYEEKFLAGEINFTEHTAATEKFNKIAPFFMPGSATNKEDDVTALMTDGAAAMAIAGNWTAKGLVEGITEAAGSEEDVAVILVPFNDPGEQVWISISPETAWGLSAVDEDDNIEEAREIYFNWIMQPENFKFVQNARGTVPVLTTLTEDQIVLPEPIKAVVPAMNDAPFVLMGFNLWTEVFRDAACTAIRDVISGNMTAENAVKVMSDTLATSNRSEG
ncbi:MAG: carbohydrate ABC transporter substrate-binding protein [Clostridiaceae bacterium]|nr:carbohydrate ABC transporter substrate-binding protein [Clostridiaceae bacterium]